VKRKIAVLVCDDHVVFREGVRSILNREDDIDVVAEAAAGHEAIELARRLEPDVVLVDMALPDMRGMDAARNIKNARPETQVLMLSMFDSTDLVSKCFQAGAAGYLLKDVAIAQLLSAIRTVGLGHSLPSPRIMRDHSTRPPPPNLHKLSAREREVLLLLAEGFSFKEIAAQLHLSVKTVDTHKCNLMRKLGFSTRAELIRFAIREGLIEA
jgi:DNA-binding NarL/FixJ family response regulator